MSDDDEAQRLRRAREVLGGAGWLFDELVNREMRAVLFSRPEESALREEAWRRARVATELKAGLEALLEAHEADLRRRARHLTQQETHDGR